MQTAEKTVNDYKNQYYREWRAKNKERLKKINAKYWKKYAERKKQEELTRNQVQP